MRCGTGWTGTWPQPSRRTGPAWCRIRAGPNPPEPSGRGHPADNRGSVVRLHAGGPGVAARSHIGRTPCHAGVTGAQQVYTLLGGVRFLGGVPWGRGVTGNMRGLHPCVAGSIPAVSTMLPSFSGQDASLSRMQRGFDSRWQYRPEPPILAGGRWGRATERSSSGQDTRLSPAQPGFDSPSLYRG